MPIPVLFAILIAVGVALWVALRGRPDPEALRRYYDADALVLDVRTPGEFRRRHARRARNIPVDELPQRIGELGDPGRIVVYCASGMRSARAAGVLRSAGFDVLDMGRISAFPEDLVEVRPNNAPV
jgi:rhodanese-related sulfurtransferase